MNINTSNTSHIQQTASSTPTKVSSVGSDPSILEDLKGFAPHLFDASGAFNTRTLNKEELADALEGGLATKSPEIQRAFANTEFANPELIKEAYFNHSKANAQERDIKEIIKVDDSYITLYHSGATELPNKYQHLVGSTQEQTLSNIMAAFGDKAERQSFNPGEGPTNAEYYQMRTGESLVDKYRQMYLNT